MEIVGLLVRRRLCRSAGSSFSRVFTCPHLSPLRLLSVPPALLACAIERGICRGRRSLLRLRIGPCPNRWPQTALPPLLPLPDPLCRHRKRGICPEEIEIRGGDVATTPISASRRLRDSGRGKVQGDWASKDFCNSARGVLDKATRVILLFPMAASTSSQPSVRGALCIDLATDLLGGWSS
jgi:hypothetical protein